MAKSLIERLGEYRQGITTSLSDQHEARMLRTLERLERDVVKDIARLPTKNGVLFNTKLAIELRPKIKGYMENTYLKTVQSNVAEYDKIAGSVVATYGKLPIPDEFKQITELDLTTVNQLKKQVFNQFEDLGNEFVSTLSDEIYQSTLVGRSTDKVIETVSGQINGIYQNSNNSEAQELVDFINSEKLKGITGTAEVTTAISRLQTIYGRDRLGNNLRRYTNQIVQDSIMGFDGQFAKFRADEIGLTYFTYTGSTIRDSRDFCRSHVGNTYSTKEISSIWGSQSWSGKSQGDPFVVRGGYNCRHHWQPTDPSWNKIDDEIPTVGEEIAQNTNIFGEVSEQESSLLPIAFGTIQTSFTRAISKLPKTEKIIPKSKSAWYQRNEDTIALQGVDMNNHKLKDTFAHEYGHRIDHKMSKYLLANNKTRDRIFAKELKENPLLIEYIAGDRNASNISNFASASISSDRKKIRKYIPLAKTEYMNDLVKIANLSVKGKSLGNKEVRDAIEKIIASKNFPLKIDEIKALLLDKGITYDLTDRNTLDFILQTKHKVLSALNNKSVLRNVNNVSYGKFADYLGAITNNEMGWGHSMGYYAKYPTTLVKGVRTGHSLEAFANYTALLNSKNKVAYRKMMEHYAKDTTKAFDELMERLDRI